VAEKNPKIVKRAPFNIKAWTAKHKNLSVEYFTDNGAAIVGKSEEVLKSKAGEALKGRVQLVFTSPPFPLNRKKKYSNLEGEAFKKWLKDYAVVLRDLLTADGSIVIEMGNAWMPRLPVMSTLAIETLLAFKKAANLHLVQEFIWFNPARLPTPAQWVTVNRMRVKDAFTRLWWLSPTTHPKADNRRVLVPYSDSMKSLLKSQKYNAGHRPSEHVINATSFLKNNGGAIPPNVLTIEDDEPPVSNLLVGANTKGTDAYHNFCKTRGLTMHPARMPAGLAKFFINFCTEAGDLVLDPFGGSNTTGAAAEESGRRWISIEAEKKYAQGGIGRFPALAALVPRKDSTNPEVTDG
jgi:site-specific DNA-methyltransferase (cytosine-N4-specific)